MAPNLPAEDPEPLGIGDAGYRALVEQIPAITYIASLSPSFHTVYMSPQVEEFLGFPVARWVEEPDFWWQVALHEQDRAHVLEVASAAEAAGGPFRCEYRMIASDGRVAWMRDEAVLVKRADGRPLFWRGVMFDVTAQNEAEEALRSSEAKYRALVEQLPAVVYIDSHHKEPRSLYLSPNVEEVLGYPPERYLAEHEMWQRTIHPDDRLRVLEAWARTVEMEREFTAEYRFVRPDGTAVWVRDNSIPVRGERGEILFWQGVILDVGARKQAEEALQQSEARYRALVEDIPAVVYVMEPEEDRRTLYVSPHVERVLGYSRDEWLEQTDIWMELLHPDDRETELAAHDLHSETGEPWTREYRLIASDGRVVWVRDQATLLRDEEGGPLFWHGVMLDITAQKEAQEALRKAHAHLERRVQARTAELAEANELMTLEIEERRRVERQLREAEERHRNLVEGMPAVTYLWELEPESSEDPAVWTSPQIQQMLGYTQEEWNGDPFFWMSRLHPHDRERVLTETMRCETTGEPFNQEYRYLARDGRIVWVLEQAVLLRRDERGHPKVFQGVMLDVTERKLAEERAAEAEERFRALAEQIPAVTYVWRLDRDLSDPGPISYISPQIERVLGYTAEEWGSDPNFWTECLHPDDREWMVPEVDRLERAGEAWDLEYRMIARDGRVVWIRDEGRVIVGGEGKPRYMQGILLDITDRRESEQRLRQAELEYRALIARIPAITYIVEPQRPDGLGLVYVSPQSERILGYTPEELVSDPALLVKILHPDDAERVHALIERSNTTGEPLCAEYRAFAKNGREVWLHAEASLVPGEHGDPPFRHGVVIDITERKLAQVPRKDTVAELRT